MHIHQEHVDILKKVIARADWLVACLPNQSRAESEEVLRFLKQYGYYGFPSWEVETFDVGSWIIKSGRPANQHDGVAIISCFSDDVLPMTPPSNDSVFPGGFSLSKQAIALYSVDRWSVLEMALFLLHEARHARHRLGHKLSNLAPLDRNDTLHEANCWMCMLNFLNAWGKANWKKIVQREVDWIIGQKITSANPNQIIYAESPRYWQGLDVIFGKTNYEGALRLRMKLVSLEANMKYWSHRYVSLSPEQVLASIIRKFYT